MFIRKIVYLIIILCILCSCVERGGNNVNQSEAPTDTPQGDPVPVYNEDIQAFIDAGLQARAIMPPVLERYYYLFSYPEQQEGENTYCVWFEDNISVDLDGDGKDETIDIILGDESGNSGIYRDMTIDIDGKQLKLETQDNMFSSFGNGAYVLDIDKNDSKKEIGISGDVWSDMLGYIISFDGKTPKLIFNDFFDIEDIDISGNGSIEIWRDKFYRELYKLKDDGSGFEKVDTKYYTTCCMYYYWKNHDEPELGITESAGKLADKPGGKRNIPVAKGTKVYFGLYTKDRWLMIMDPGGNLLGWLPVEKALSLVPSYDNLLGDEAWLP